MSADEQSRFLQELAEDLNSRNILLPSFPDVVVNIRTALEDPMCTSERLADVVRTDPVLNAKLLMAANSAFHNRAGIEIVDLNLAISRLGYEVVRNTAIALAVEQIYFAGKHTAIKNTLEALWQRSMSLASMSFVVARNTGTVNPDSAFLCGLLHEVGKLYILTKANSYPGLMGDDTSLDAIMDQWYASVGRSIIESWGFSAEIAESVEAEDSYQENAESRASLVDVVYLSKQLLSDTSGNLGGGIDELNTRLNVTEESLPDIKEAFGEHAASMRSQ